MVKVPEVNLVAIVIMTENVITIIIEVESKIIIKEKINLLFIEINVLTLPNSIVKLNFGIDYYV